MAYSGGRCEETPGGGWSPGAAQQSEEGGTEKSV